MQMQKQNAMALLRAVGAADPDHDKFLATIAERYCFTCLASSSSSRCLQIPSRIGLFLLSCCSYPFLVLVAPDLDDNEVPVLAQIADQRYLHSV